MEESLAAWSKGERRRFNGNPDRSIWVQSAPGHVVASWVKTLYDDYLFLLISIRQQIQRKRVQRNIQEH